MIVKETCSRGTSKKVVDEALTLSSCPSVLQETTKLSAGFTVVHMQPATEAHTNAVPKIIVTTISVVKFHNMG